MVEQPTVSSLKDAFMTRFIAMQRATLAAILACNAVAPMIYTVNPTGHAWLLLAFPGGTEADARSMFSADATVTGDQQPGADGVLRIALAGPAYTGFAVLAACLLGCAPIPHATGEQPEIVFWREEHDHIDPNEWSVGCFKTRDQLLPTFLLHFDGSTARSDINEGRRLKQQNSLLQTRNSMLIGQVDRLRKATTKQISRNKEASRSRHRRCMGQDMLAGHTQVENAGRTQPRSSLLSIDFGDNEAEEERLEEKLSQCEQKRKRGAGTRGEMGLDTILVQYPGPKKIRLDEDGTRPGGLMWDHRVMLCAALTRSVGKSSLKQAGSAGLDFISRGALAVFVKPQPLGKCKSRRLKKDKRMPVLGSNGISEASLRLGVAALELAKNDALIDWIRDSDSLFLGYDSSTVANLSLQIVSWRAIKIVESYTDGAGTCKLRGDSRSGSFDLHALGSKRVTEHETQNPDGSTGVTSIEASDRFGAQMQHAGAWEAASRHPSANFVSDGGTEAIGKGNREAARLNMAGENSVVYRACLLRRTGDDGMKLMNKLGIWVPLQEAFGFNPLDGDLSNRKPEGQRLDTIKNMLIKAQREYRKNTGTDHTVDGTTSLPDSSEDGGEIPANSDEEDRDASLPARDDVNRPQPRSRPIYDPLCGPPELNAPPIAPMSIIDFFAWDIASAYPWLCLGERMDDLTEDMVASVERFVEILIDEACKEVHCDQFTAVSLEGFKSLRPGSFVGDQAIYLVLENLTRVLGGRFVDKDGTYTTGPVSPLILLNKSIPADDATKALYVLDSVNAARLEHAVTTTERHAPRKGQRRADKMVLEALKVMAALFMGRSSNRRPTAAETETERKKIVFERGSGVFAVTHRPGHYVSTEVDNLGVPTEVEESGQGSSRNAVTFTRADSNSRKPSFCGQMHEALYLALSAVGVIGATQDVDYVGLPLPPQGRPDCAFYVLLRLVSKLTGEFPLPSQWQVITRILRCWTALQVFRRLLEDGAVVDVREIPRSRFGSNVQQPLTANVQNVAALELPKFHVDMSVRGPGHIWTRAIASLKGFEEREHKAQAKKTR